MGLLRRAFAKSKPEVEITLSQEESGATVPSDDHEIWIANRSTGGPAVRVHVLEADTTMLPTRFAVDIPNTDGQYDKATDIIIDTNRLLTTDNKREIATQAARLAFTLLGEE